MEVENILDENLAPKVNLGSLLYEKRLESGEPLNSISKKIKVKEKFLDSLEKNDYSTFPSQTFAVGFLKAYAKYLHLDEKYLVTLLKGNFKKEEPDLHFLSFPPEKVFPSKGLVLLSLIILIILGLRTSFEEKEPFLTLPQEIISLKDNPDKEDVSFPTEDITKTIIVEQEQKKEIKDERQNLSTHAQFKALDKCWVEIKNADKKVLFDKILQAGEKLEVDFAPGKIIKVGNAGGIETFIKGKPSGLLGANGDVVQNIPLDSYESFSNYIQTHTHK
jgi:cytoskeletal protein RodZ